MDDSNRMRRQNEPPVHSNPNQRYSLNDPSQQRRSLAGISNDRYRPASLAGPSSSGRGMGAPGNYSNYYSEPSASFSTPNMPGTAIAYGPEYGHDSRQTQGFGGYSTATTMMYNVGQPSTQNTVYDAQQFSSRQPAAMQMMPPDVASSYFGSEAGASAGPSLQQPAQGSSGSANVYQQSNAMNYASNSMSSVSAMPQATNTADVSMTDDHDYAEGALEEKWVSYQRQLGSIFQEIVNGSLESASETLLSVTSWLLSQVADLGLNLDDTNLHADRIQLWNDFNHAWLGLGQRQIDLMTSSQQLSRPQSLVSKAMIKKMGNELIRLCDGIERHGLVDYQYGVWEDQITAGEQLQSCPKSLTGFANMCMQFSKTVWTYTMLRKKAVTAVTDNVHS
ncbi:uncharacterized protein FPRO_04276 [Fusarium proliferatum ET1]|uniref:Uncharacterized protein n=1 Tax=Fusarium proliferatum (strain ET1) TaxID=1227346 RepID=A0A1L7VFD6_FUSPR|nr:uncharacterized protein FPRO_04276 [Fusarium proliferatum ET1]CZR39379.1 uncharacterized protein FPRO_04276 [Fusarium proliferatum ET1]